MKSLTKEQKIAIVGIAILVVLFILFTVLVFKPDKENTVTQDEAVPYFTSESTEYEYIEPEAPVVTKIEIPETVVQQKEPAPEEEEEMEGNQVLIAPGALEPDTVVDGAVTDITVNGYVTSQPKPKTEEVKGMVDKEEPEAPKQQDEIKYTEDEEVKHDTYKYIALGNSVTCNTVDDTLWWSTCGMAATKPENDYVHLVCSWLGTQTTQELECYSVSVKPWEVAVDRNSTLSTFDKYLTEDTDLVTIQTGENITERMENLPVEYLCFFQHVKERCPNAKVVVLGELLWPKDNIEAAKINACGNLGITFINVDSFLNGYESTFRSAMGIQVMGDDNNLHTISNEVVAAHPNDEGMAHIAQLVIDAIK